MLFFLILRLTFVSSMYFLIDVMFIVEYVRFALFFLLVHIFSCFYFCFFFFFFKQKTAYEMRISDWSSDVCSSDLIFGATGHIGLPLARWIRYKSPETRLRLVSRNADQRQRLQVEFPDAEVVAADYLDPASMAAALEGISAAFVVTPDFLDEQRAMEILCAEAKSRKTLRQIVRILGNLPYTKLSDIPEKWRSVGGTLTQHHVARAVLDGSGLPVTYLNMPAYQTG